MQPATSLFDTKPQPAQTDNTFGLGLLLFAAFLYFVPVINASLKGHRNIVSIGVLNLLLGWTFIGWVVALVWSFSAKPSPVDERLDGAHTQCPDPIVTMGHTSAGSLSCKTFLSFTPRPVAKAKWTPLRANRVSSGAILESRPSKRLTVSQNVPSKSHTRRRSRAACRRSM
ncbi:MAG: hypothetical protein CRU78_05865 [Candidatus Accumulibacter phosphatis]|uniref:Superinfection immunity protein n=1 Tax=Candidatus Accumulibacter phosphatis TaxID=327160 RepID=A0A6A7RRX8_9PROT|nr:hypothetical protein [Candidatus Accumulibacter phosphatis]